MIQTQVEMCGFSGRGLSDKSTLGIVDIQAAMPRRLSKKKIGAQFSLLATENYNRGVAQKDVDAGLVR